MVRFNSSKNIDDNRDLTIKIMDFVWYEYLGMDENAQDYDWHLQDTINEIVNEHFGVKEEED